MKVLAVFPLAACCLMACGGGGGGDGGGVGDPTACNSISGGGTTAEVVTSECPACVATASDQAIDGDFDTAAVLAAPTVAGFASLRVTAQPGVVFSGGSTVSAIVSRSVGSADAAASLVLRTYLSGEFQEEYAFQTNTGGLTVTSPKKKYSFTASKSYDAVAFGVSGVAENVEIEYFEYCSG